MILVTNENGAKRKRKIWHITKEGGREGEAA